MKPTKLLPSINTSYTLQETDTYVVAFNDPRKGMLRLFQGEADIYKAVETANRLNRYCMRHASNFVYLILSVTEIELTSN